jgi:hypothetical protein
MERTLKEHLADLNRRLGELSLQQMGKETTHRQVNEIEFEIRTLKLAILHYQTALELETKVKGF